MKQGRRSERLLVRNHHFYNSAMFLVGDEEQASTFATGESEPVPIE
jgi:hypothetical protein